MTKPATGAFYLPELDVVRLLAFLAVFFSHGLPASPSTTFSGAAVRALSLGLPLFFCLSAFLITKLLLLERDRTGSVDLKKFYSRRLLRIWPLYLSMLAVSAAFSAMHHTLHITGIWYLAALFMVANTVWWVRTTVLHLWSISVEEQFYLFWPALVRRCSDRFLLLCVLGTFALANLVLFYFGLVGAPQSTRIWANTSVQSEFFAAGILLALCYRQSHSWHFLTRLTMFVLALGFWFCSVRMLHAFANPDEATTGSISLCTGYGFAVLGCLLIMISMLGTRKWPGSLVYLGKISYGLYVFHGVSLMTGEHLLLRSGRLFSLAASLLMNIAIAALSYRFFESRFLIFKQRFEVVQSRPIGA